VLGTVTFDSMSSLTSVKCFSRRPRHGAHLYVLTCMLVALSCAVCCTYVVWYVSMVGRGRAVGVCPTEIRVFDYARYFLCVGSGKKHGKVSEQARTDFGKMRRTH
jgi:hypothetical protein